MGLHPRRIAPGRCLALESFSSLYLLRSIFANSAALLTQLTPLTLKPNPIAALVALDGALYEAHAADSGTNARQRSGCFGLASAPAFQPVRKFAIEHRERFEVAFRMSARHAR